jgi:AGCS family alanine or glycine:cation symporter
VLYFGLGLVWNLADLFNGLMAIPNLVTLLLLSGVIANETKKYLVDGDINDISQEQAINVTEDVTKSVNI